MSFSSIREVGRRLRSGSMSPTELCHLCLDKIGRTRSRYNAFITVTDQDALEAAKQSSIRMQQGRPLGPLDGIPITVKDNYCTEGVLTSCASKMLASYVPPYTATVVKKLRGAGAVILGKTNMDEFAMGCGSVDSFYGPVRNPWRSPSTAPDEFHIAGGSSGGSAVTVAAGIAFGGVASDTGGSTRNPAALCGVVGLKPSYGLLSRHGLVPLVNSMDVVGLHARNVDDTALLFSAMLGGDPMDPTSVSEPNGSLELPEEPRIRNLRFGIPKEYDFPTLGADIRRVWRKVADLLVNAGASVTEVSLPHAQYSIACYSVLNSCEVASNFARYDGIKFGHRSGDEKSMEALYATTRSEGFNDVVKGRILAGNYFLLKKNYERYFMRALRIRRLISGDFEKVFGQDGVHFLLSPVTISTAPLYRDFVQKDGREQTALQDVCTQSANMAGIPAVSIPICLSPDSLPMSLQLMGPIFSDASLLAAAKGIETAVAFPSRVDEDEQIVQQTRF